MRQISHAARFILTILCCLHLLGHSLAILLSSKPDVSDWTIYKRREWTRRGIVVIGKNCTSSDLTKIKNAILDASYLAGAGLNAAANFTQAPFNYFFKADIATANTVAGVFRRVQSSQQGQGALIFATCVDVYNFCPIGNLAYAAIVPDGTVPPLIVFCPRGLVWPRNPVPCTENPGHITLGSIMLHEMVHVPSISGSGLEIDDIESVGESPRNMNEALDAGVDTTTDADAYAHLGSFAWDMGLGGPPWNQQTTCLQNFPRGNFDMADINVAAGAAARGG